MKYWNHTPAILLIGLTALTNARAEPVIPTFTISAERVEQNFTFEADDFDATIDTVTLTPGLDWGDWHISATLPWQSIDGQYFFNNLYPNLAQACSRINDLSALQKLILVRNTELTTDSLEYCADTGGIESTSVEEGISGWNDVELFANYFIPSTSTWLAGSIGLGYEHDNGDEYEGLGNGAKQVFTETTWMASSQRLSLSTTLGYYFVLEDSSAIDLQNHGYATLDGRVQLGEHFELGISYHYLQTDNDVFDDYDYLTYSTTFYFGHHLSLQAFINDYSDDTGLPDDEVGAFISYSF